MEGESGTVYDTLSQAEQLEKSGQSEEAISRYSDFISQAEGMLGPRGRGCYKPRDASNLQEKLGLAYNNRGFLYYLKVEFKLAAEDYTQALLHNSGMAVAYYNCGLIHYRLGRFQEAVDDMKKALSLKPDLEPAQQCLRQSLEDLTLLNSK